MSERTSDPKSSRFRERLPLVADVVVNLQPEAIEGSGRDISKVGVYFICEQEIRAMVRIGDREVAGVVVRVENHGKDYTGIAVRFDEGAFDA